LPSFGGILYEASYGSHNSELSLMKSKIRFNTCYIIKPVIFIILLSQKEHN